MANNERSSVIPLKMVEKETPKTLKDVLDIYTNGKDEDQLVTLGEFNNALLIADIPSGLRIVPFKSSTVYELIGMLEMAKATLIESMIYDYEDEE